MLPYQIINRLERYFASMQGKGYLAPLEKEASLLCKSSGVIPALAIDIGGNIGDYTEALLRLNPNINIHMFEPSVTNIQTLNNKFSDNNRVTIVPMAVSDKTGASILHYNMPGSGLASLSKRKLDHFNIDFELSESISTIRFEDYWINKLGSCEIDIVKIDVEGHEFSVLNSFGDALYKTKSIQFEFGGTCIDTRIYFQDFWYFFFKNNYSIYRITPFGLQKINAYKESDECFYYTNFIAKNNLYK